MDAEQVIRLTAAVVWELRRPNAEDVEDSRDALTLRLADAVGIALATEPAQRFDPSGPHPTRGPRGTTRTHGLLVKDYPARVAPTPASSPTPSSSQDMTGGCREA